MTAGLLRPQIAPQHFSADTTDADRVPRHCGAHNCSHTRRRDPRWYPVPRRTQLQVARAMRSTPAHDTAARRDQILSQMPDMYAAKCQICTQPNARSVQIGLDAEDYDWHQGAPEDVESVVSQHRPQRNKDRAPPGASTLWRPWASWSERRASTWQSWWRIWTGL